MVGLGRLLAFALSLTLCGAFRRSTRHETKGDGKLPKRLWRPLTVAVLAMVALSALPRLAAPALAAPRASGHISANEVRHEDPASRGTVAALGGGQAAALSTGQTGAPTLSVTSAVIDAGQRFDHVRVHWRAAAGKEDALFVEVR